MTVPPKTRSPRRLRAWRLYQQALAPAPDVVYRTIEYTRYHRRPPRLRHPLTFTEKVNWRILHDRREVLAWTCDKLAMKEHAAAVGLASPRTLWSGTDLRELADLDLPERWVLKPNHRTGLVELGTGRPDIEHLLARTRGWVDEVNARTMREWAYSRARPCLLLEEYVDGARELDARVLVFGGRARALWVDADDGRDVRPGYYSLPWAYAATTPRTIETSALPEPRDVPEPEWLGAVVSAAERLAGDLDFMRVDLYLHEGRPLFGETTPYPNGGLHRLVPVGFDRWLGDQWVLPAL